MDIVNWIFTQVSSSTIIDVLAKILGILSVIMLAFIWIKDIAINKKRALIYLIGKRPIKLKNMKKKMKSHRKVNFTSYRLEENYKIIETQTDSKKIIKGIRKNNGNNIYDNRIWFVVGNGGYGKSILLDKIALSCRLRYKSFNNDITSLGVIHLRLIEFNSLDEISDKLQSRLRNGKTVVIIDSLDEFCNKNHLDFEETIKNVYDLLSRVSNELTRVIISTRPEILGGKASDLARIKRGHLSARVLLMNDLTKPQVKEMFRKIGGSYGKHQISHLAVTDGVRVRKPKGKSIKKFNEYLETSKNVGVFKIPFIINYGEYLINEFSIDGLLKYNSSNIYKGLINLWLSKEYETIRESNDEILATEETYSEEFNSYCSDINVLTTEITNHFLINKTIRVNGLPKSLLKEIVRNLDLSIEDSTAYIRNFMIERMDGNFEFIHIAFYEYFLAEILMEASFVQRKKFLLDTELFNIRKLYVHKLLEYKKDHIFRILGNIESYGNDENIPIISENCVFSILESEIIKLKDTAFDKIDVVLTLFPLNEQIKYRNIVIRDDVAYNYMIEGVLCLSNQDLRLGCDLSLFPKIRELNLNNCMLESLDFLGELNLEKLAVHNNNELSKDDFESIESKVIELDIGDIQLFDELMQNSKVVELRIKLQWNDDLAIHIFMNRCGKVLIKSIVEPKVLYSLKSRLEKDLFILIFKYYYEQERDWYKNDIQIETLSKSYELGKYLMYESDYVNAEYYLLENYEQQMQSPDIDNDNLMIYRALYYLARTLYQMERFEESMFLYKRVYKKFTEHYSELNKDMFMTMLQLGILHNKFSENNVAIKYFKRLLNALEKLDINNDMYYYTPLVLDEMAVCYRDMEKFKEAGVIFYRAYSVERELRNCKTGKLIDYLYSSAYMNHEIKDDKVSIILLEKCCDMIIKSDEAISENIRQTVYSLLGICYLNCKYYMKAENIYDVLLRDRITSNNLGIVHPKTSEVYVGLLRALFYQGERHEDIESLCCNFFGTMLHHVDEIYESNEIIKALKLTVRYLEKNNAKKEIVLQSCLLLDKLHLNVEENLDDSLDILHSKSIALLELGYFEDAECLAFDVYTKSLELSRLGPQSRETISSKYIYGLALYQQKKLVEAYEVILEVYHFRSKQVITDEHAEILNRTKEVLDNIHNEILHNKVIN